MEKEYLNYTADQLVNEDSFLQAEKDPTGKGKLFWDELAAQDETFAHELQLARTVLNLVEKKKIKDQLPEKEKLLLWQEIEDSKKQYKQQQTRRMWIRRSMTIAASFLVIAFALYIFIPDGEAEFDYSSLVSDASSLIYDKDQNITLVLSDEKEISLDGQEATVNYQDGYVEINTDAGEGEKTDEAKDAFNQLIVPKGKRSFVTLADGTQMWVNAGTIVVYPIEFTGNKREIYVEGEIFLDVTPNKKNPFIVKTKDMHIEVLGTQFNVSAYNEDEAHHIILVEGKVEVGLPDKKKQVMQPNQQLTYSDKSWNIQTVNDLDHLAWRYGYYQYKDQTLTEVLHTLAKYYGETIDCDPAIGQLLCSGKLDLKTDIEEVLSIVADAASLKISAHNNMFQLFINH